MEVNQRAKDVFNVLETIYLHETDMFEDKEKNARFTLLIKACMDFIEDNADI